MNLSAKTEYACIAVLELSLRYSTREPVRIRDIADTHGIPSRFLVQILLQLKGAGLVSSTRGAAGGYQLVRPPEEITLNDVMSVVDTHANQLKLSATHETPQSRVLLESWNRVAEVQREILTSTTFAELARKAGSGEQDMYYI